MAGLLHDIGKIGTPATILNKPGKLTADEFSIVMQHPEIGHALLLNSGHLDAAVSDVALHHHENSTAAVIRIASAAPISRCSPAWVRYAMSMTR